MYDFVINESGTVGELLQGDSAMMPAGYYAAMVPRLLRADPRTLTPARRAELDLFGVACGNRPEFGGMVQALFDGLLPHPLAPGWKR